VNLTPVVMSARIVKRSCTVGVLAGRQLAIRTVMRLWFVGDVVRCDYKRKMKKQICKNCYYIRNEAFCSVTGTRWCSLRKMKVCNNETCTRFQYPVVRELRFEDTREILKETVQQEKDYQEFCNFIQDKQEK
jgi:hypothetical protein